MHNLTIVTWIFTQWHESGVFRFTRLGKNQALKYERA